MKNLLLHIKLIRINKKQITLITAFISVFILGGIVSILVWKYFTTCKAKYTFINPNLGCGYETKFDKSNPIVLKDTLTTYINSEKEKGEVGGVSVYFRDLRDGPTMGINEDNLFISASLLKLPVALTYFKLSEEEMPDVLDRKLFFELGKSGGADLPQFFQPSKSVVAGSTYTVNELIFNSLAYSDNMSNDVLKTYLKTISVDQDYLLRTFKELGLIEPASVTTSDISTRAYASIFRQLYNASYLSNDDSEKILATLSQSEFDQGIAGGVPSNIKIANKFGERDLVDEKQLHDCGIVYYPDNPYLICIMTRGKDYSTLADVIKNISKIVYTEMYMRSGSK